MITLMSTENCTSGVAAHFSKKSIFKQLDVCQESRREILKRPSVRLNFGFSVESVFSFIGPSFESEMGSKDLQESQKMLLDLFKELENLTAPCDTSVSVEGSTCCSSSWLRPPCH